MPPAQVLYLDFDGVLHDADVRLDANGKPWLAHGSGALFQHGELLAEALAPYPDVRIVLSTDWARRLGVHKAARQLPGLLRERVIGAVSAPLLKKRVDQVMHDANANRPGANWICVDDDIDFGYVPSELQRRFLRTPPAGIVSVMGVLQERFREFWGMEDFHDHG